MNAKLLGDSMHKINSWDDGIGYAMATTLLRLPGYAPMLAFNHIVDVPLIVPHAKLSKEEVCKAFFFHEEAVLKPIHSWVIAGHTALCRG